MINLTKSVLTETVAAKTGQSPSVVKAVIDTALAEIVAGTAAGHKVQLTGFGSFETKQRAARTGRNPRTGEPVEIPASARLTFKPSKAKT